MTVTQPTGKPFQLQGMAPLLQVYDMPASLQFYRDILGFEIVSSSGDGDDVDWVLLKYGDIELMLNTLYEKPVRPQGRDLTRQAIHEDIVLYFGCPDIDSAYEYLSGKHVEVKKPQVTGYGWKAINFKDPDGYPLCFHWPLKE
jgi:catechol 2,3-dioxygenase-like lactoylglutathione lyase family enzyme